MAICKFCGQPFVWGRNGDRWIPLVPIGEEGDLDRKFQDADGNLRAQHRDVCEYVPAVDVTKLAVPIPAEMIVPSQAQYPEPSKGSRKRS